ncbi:hypothetical protein DIPPA_09759 [Diplonema papillatum]|nr:hypothetical protein DIPPA_09759 [Diplonema papillatum]
MLVAIRVSGISFDDLASSATKLAINLAEKLPGDFPLECQKICVFEDGVLQECFPCPELLSRSRQHVLQASQQSLEVTYGFNTVKEVAALEAAVEASIITAVSETFGAQAAVVDTSVRLDAAEEPEDDDGNNNGVIIAVVVSVCVFCCLLVVVGIVLWRVRMSKCEKRRVSNEPHKANGKNVVDDDKDADVVLSPAEVHMSPEDGELADRPSSSNLRKNITPGSMELDPHH